MKKRKHTTNEVIVILREVEHLCMQGRTIEDAVKCFDISEETYYRWREKFGWMTSEEVTKMRQLEQENAKLKELIELWNSMSLDSQARRHSMAK